MAEMPSSLPLGAQMSMAPMVRVGSLVRMPRNAFSKMSSVIVNTPMTLPFLSKTVTIRSATCTGPRCMSSNWNAV